VRPDLSEISPGLYVRNDTPKDVHLTDDFLRRIIHESESFSFNRIVVKIAKQRNADKSRKPTVPGK
jgi:hypothetical protein